jgi:hypothetical protein
MGAKEVTLIFSMSGVFMILARLSLLRSLRGNSVAEMRPGGVAGRQMAADELLLWQAGRFRARHTPLPLARLLHRRQSV